MKNVFFLNINKLLVFHWSLSKINIYKKKIDFKTDKKW